MTGVQTCALPILDRELRITGQPRAFPRQKPAYAQAFSAVADLVDRSAESALEAVPVKGSGAAGSEGQQSVVRWGGLAAAPGSHGKLAAVVGIRAEDLRSVSRRSVQRSARAPRTLVE